MGGYLAGKYHKSEKKRCSTCKGFKTRTAFYGNSNTCKVCADNKARTEDMKERIKALEGEVKRANSLANHKVEIVQVPPDVVVNRLVKEILDCPLCLRKGYVFTPPNKIATCVCHMSLLVKIAGMGSNESVGSEARSEDDDSPESDGEFRRRGSQEG